MGRTPRPWRILVAVAPPLLGDVLSHLVARADLDVVVHDPEVDLEPDGARFDLVVTSGRTPPGISAGASLHLPDERGHGGDGVLVTGTDLRLVPLAGIASVVQVIDELCPAGGTPRTAPR